jgi:AbrB family looped-hinge helix DNA binding protein
VVSVTVSSKGQIAIPKAVREELGLTEGTKLNLSIKGQTLVLRRQEVIDWRSWRGKFKGAPLDRDLAEDHRQEIERDRRQVRGA